MSRLSPADLETCATVRASCACNKLRRAARAMTQRYELALAPSGLKITQLPLLVALSDGRAAALTPLAEALGLDPTTLARNLGVIERRGLVTMLADEADARVRLVMLTEEGASVLAAALAVWRDVQREVEHDFGATRLQELFAELSVLTATVQY